MSGTTFSGRKVNYGLAIEAARGTAVDPQIWCRWETADFFDMATATMNQSALNVLNKFSGSEVTETWSAGQLAGKITDHAFGYFLYSGFGGYSVQTHSGESVVYDHTFTEANTNTASTLTVTRSDPNTNTQYANAMVNSIEIDVKAGDFVRHTTQLVAMPNTTPGAESPVYLPYEQEFIAKYATVKFASSLNGLNGAVAIPLASLKLTIDKNVNPYWIIGQTKPGDIFADSVEVKGEMTLRYTDQTYYNLLFPSNTLQSVSIDLKNTGVTLGNSTNPELSFTMPACYLTEFKPDQSIDGIVNQNITFEAVYDITNGFAIKSVLTNKHSVYSAAGLS